MIIIFLKQIKDSSYTEEELDYWSDYNLNIPENRNNGDSLKDEKLFVHENFRIWFLSEIENLNNIPGWFGLLI